MAAIAWSDVVDLDASLSGIAVGIQNVILGRVEQLSADFFGGVDSSSYKLARILLAAHIAVLTRHSSGGPVTAESEGGVSRSYANVLQSGAHSTTGHGRAFDLIVRSMPGQLGVTS